MSTTKIRLLKLVHTIVATICTSYLLFTTPALDLYIMNEDESSLLIMLVMFGILMISNLYLKVIVINNKLNKPLLFNIKQITNKVILYRVNALLSSIAVALGCLVVFLYTNSMLLKNPYDSTLVGLSFTIIVLGAYSFNMCKYDKFIYKLITNTFDADISISLKKRLFNWLKFIITNTMSILLSTLTLGIMSTYIINKTIDKELS